MTTTADIHYIVLIKLARHPPAPSPLHRPRRHAALSLSEIRCRQSATRRATDACRGRVSLGARVSLTDRPEPPATPGSRIMQVRAAHAWPGRHAAKRGCIPSSKGRGRTVEHEEGSDMHSTQLWGEVAGKSGKHIMMSANANVRAVPLAGHRHARRAQAVLRATVAAAVAE